MDRCTSGPSGKTFSSNVLRNQSLCAIVIPSVSVSTIWSKEAEKILAVKDYILKEDEILNGDDLLKVSDRAIKVLVWKTLKDQNNETGMEILHEPKRRKCKVLLLD
jgi:hypothetical protein